MIPVMARYFVAVHLDHYADLQIINALFLSRHTLYLLSVYWKTRASHASALKRNPREIGIGSDK